jgi:acyl-CoA thioester hydrolase
VPVLNRVEIDYKDPLRSGDVMESKLWVEMKGVRFVFHQDIFNKKTGKQAIKAIVSCVCIENGKLTRGERLAEAFKEYL